MPNTKRLFTDASSRKYKKGEVVLHAGDEAHQLFWIVNGFVKVYTITNDGDERILLIRKPGEVFPMIRVLDTPQYHLRYFYEGMTDTKVLYKDRFKIAQDMQKDPLATQSILEQTIRLSNELAQHLQIIENKDAIAKVTMLLPYLIQVCGSHLKPSLYRLELRLTHQDIANMIGLTRETTSIQMKKLEDQGVIQQQRTKWLIDTKQLLAFQESQT